jgi:hypothetical protein
MTKPGTWLDGNTIFAPPLVALECLGWSLLPVPCACLPARHCKQQALRGGIQSGREHRPHPFPHMPAVPACHPVGSAGTPATRAVWTAAGAPTTWGHLPENASPAAAPTARPRHLTVTTTAASGGPGPVRTCPAAGEARPRAEPGLMITSACWPNSTGIAPPRTARQNATAPSNAPPGTRSSSSAVGCCRSKRGRFV